LFNFNNQEKEQHREIRIEKPAIPVEAKSLRIAENKGFLYLLFAPDFSTSSNSFLIAVEFILSSASPPGVLHKTRAFVNPPVRGQTYRERLISNE
jgi:hypothetical protein